VIVDSSDQEARVAIIDRREIELDLQAVRLALEWSPQCATAFGLPPLRPQAVRSKPIDGTIEVTYGELTSTRVFMLPPRHWALF